MNGNHVMRQAHRWLSMAFTLGFVINGVAVSLKRYSAWMGLLALVPLLLLLVTGLYLFVLPYATKWRSARRSG